MASPNFLTLSDEILMEPPDPRGTLKIKEAKLSSEGQIEASPANGDTVMVCPPRWGILSLYPPSMANSPRNFGGINPDITGTNDEAQTASTRSSFDINSLMSMFDLLLALVRDRYSLPFDCSATSSGKKSKKAVFNFL